MAGDADVVGGQEELLVALTGVGSDSSQDGVLLAGQTLGGGRTRTGVAGPVALLAGRVAVEVVAWVASALAVGHKDSVCSAGAAIVVKVAVTCQTAGITIDTVGLKIK